MDPVGAATQAMTSTALIDALFTVVVLSLVLERGLAFILETRLDLPKWVWKLLKKGDRPPGPLVADLLGSTLKSALTFGTAWAVCHAFGFEVMTALFGKAASGSPTLNVLLTATVAAGGSAGSIKLFQDVLGMSKVARDAAREAREAEAQARLLKAKTDTEVAALAAAQAKAETEAATERARTEAAEMRARQAAAQAAETTSRATVDALALAQPWDLATPPPAP